MWKGKAKIEFRGWTIDVVRRLDVYITVLLSWFVFLKQEWGQISLAIEDNVVIT